MHQMISDLRYGSRTLIKKPAFTAFAVLALALGIGANATIFSLVNALILRPPVARDPERIVNVHAVSRDGSGFHAFSYGDYSDYRADQAMFAELAAWTLDLLSLSTGEEARVAAGQLVSENYFDVFGVKPAAGRFFVAEEGEGLGAHPVVVIGHRLWQRLGGEPSVVGSALHVNNRPLTIVGVAPEGFTGAFGGVGTDVWVPISMQPLVEPGAELDNRGYVWLEMVGRLAPGVSTSEASAFMKTRYQQLAEAHPGSHPQEGSVDLGAFGTVPGQMRGGVSTLMAILMGVVGLLLLITCVNVAGMLLSRAVERRREIAVRLAIGAGRGRLVRQLITESLLLFLLGGAAGTMIAHWAARLFLTVELPLPVPIDLSLGVDLRVLAFTLAVTLVAGILFGLAPALQATRLDVVSSLSHVGGGDGPRQVRARSAFVVAQVALALLLLICAGLFLRSLEEAATIHPGFEAEGVHLASVDLSLHGYEEEAGQDFYARLRERVVALPGVESMSFARVVPLGLGNSTVGFNVPGHQPPLDDQAHQADSNTVDVDYFRTLAIPVVRGRGFDASDRAGGPPAVVINASLAEKFWPGENPLGQQIQLGAGNAPLAEIVGVVGDAKYRTLGEDPRFFIYRPFAQSYSPRMTIHLRQRDGAAGMPQALREQIRTLDRHLPVAGEIPLADSISVSLLPQRVASSVTAIFGVLGLLLVAIGVYGVTAFAVSQRRRELGVRVALGARTLDVLTLVLRQGLRLAAGGVVLGLAGALALTRVLTSLLYGVSATDPWVFGGMSVVLGSIVLGGSLIPAWRAARTDPLRALRYE